MALQWLIEAMLRSAASGVPTTGPDSVQYQHILHRNLIYLATIADATPPSTQKTVD